MRKTKIRSRQRESGCNLEPSYARRKAPWYLRHSSHCQVTNSAQALIGFLQVNPSKPCLNPDTCTSLPTSHPSEV